MSITIIEESPGSLTQYEKVPIAFWVRSRFLIDSIENRLTFVEEPVDPYLKDYDVYERPSKWYERFDISNWVVFSAFDGEARIGGATVAWKTPGLDMLEDRDDLACLWDLRIHPEYRNRGVGKMLFDEVAKWAIDRQCKDLKVETQDINVAACRFYERLGCELRAVNKDAYPTELNELQLLWYLDLKRPLETREAKNGFHRTHN